MLIRLLAFLVFSVEYNQRLAKVITKYLDKKATQQVDPEVKAEEFKEIGNKALLAKDFETAMANYSSAIDQSPNGPNTHVYYANRAYAQVSLKNYEAAIGDCEASISLSNDYKKAHARLCQATYLAKRYEDCVRACEQCLELDPSDKAIQDYKMKAEGQLGMFITYYSLPRSIPYRFSARLRRRWQRSAWN